MARKITIIGAGQVGSTVAYALTLKQLASEIVIIDIVKEKAMGEAMDIRQGTPFIGPVNVRDGDYEDAKGSDIVIFTSGVGRKPGQSRLDLTQTNVNITKSVIPLITRACPDALYVIVANPVDILTYQFIKMSVFLPAVFSVQVQCSIQHVSALALLKTIKFVRKMFMVMYSVNTEILRLFLGLWQTLVLFQLMLMHLLTLVKMFFHHSIKMMLKTISANLVVLLLLLKNVQTMVLV